MKNRTVAATFVALFLFANLFVNTAPAQAGIGLRLGAGLPQGEFRDLAKTGWMAEIHADIDLLNTPFVNVAVAAGQMDFGEKEVMYVADGDIDALQESKISLTGGGIGLRATPPTVFIKPFAEAMLRIASVEQDHESGLNGSEIDSKTRVGYQISGGLAFSIVPTLDFELGASYLQFPGTKFRNQQLSEDEVDLKALTIFAGVRVNVGV